MEHNVDVANRSTVVNDAIDVGKWSLSFNYISAALVIIFGDKNWNIEQSAAVVAGLASLMNILAYVIVKLYERRK